MKEKRITGSLIAKVVAFFVLAASAMIGFACIFLGMSLYNLGGFDYKYQENCVQVVAREMMVNDAWDEMHELRVMAAPLYANGMSGEQLEKTIGLLEEEYRDRNFTVEFYEDTSLLWGNYSGYETPYSFRYTYTEWVKVPVETKDGDENKQASASYSGTDKSQNPEKIVIKDIASESTVTASAQETESQEGKLSASEAVTEEPLTENVRKDFTCRLYVDPKLSIDDEYSTAYRIATYLSEGRYQYPVYAAICVVIAMIAFIFLMCSAGHRNGREGICPSVITGIHFDFLTVFFGIVAICGLYVLLSVMDLVSLGNLLPFVMVLFICCAEVIWCTIFCMEFALRLKLGKWWQHTLIASVFRWLLRLVSITFDGIKALIKGFPMVLNVVLIYLAICIAEFVGLIIWGSGELAIVWFLEKIILFAVVMYLALVCKKLQAGSKALAEGDLSFQLDTSLMLLDFKEHGENLNRIGQGISKAVEERMKSEHLKTELITNVSHDLKTPLTSIINYADLLAHEVLKVETGEATDAEKMLMGSSSLQNRRDDAADTSTSKIADYAEVLLRQSKRLKKLLEDLVEASKATTGALEVNLEQCEIGVLLSQAVGEYEQRFAEKQLQLMVHQPEEPVRIMADGRHLWRVFDNLLNNICKYAQENSRVYLSVENKENQVRIIFRNMSKYALEVSAEELEERFVRGDKSRHMEGNGLGLSIAKSLVELQNGRMEVVTDGDLFKVTLYFTVQ